jgi:hypothetical protein
MFHARAFSSLINEFDREGSSRQSPEIAKGLVWSYIFASQSQATRVNCEGAGWETGGDWARRPPQERSIALNTFDN